MMEDRTKKDIQRAMSQLEKIISDLIVNMMFCDSLDYTEYENLIAALSAVQGEYPIESTEGKR